MMMGEESIGGIGLSSSRSIGAPLGSPRLPLQINMTLRSKGLDAVAREESGFFESRANDGDEQGEWEEEEASDSEASGGLDISEDGTPVRLVGACVCDSASSVAGCSFFGVFEHACDGAVVDPGSSGCLSNSWILTLP
jgi:hypothetical protein